MLSQPICTGVVAVAISAYTGTVYQLPSRWGVSVSRG